MASYCGGRQSKSLRIAAHLVLAPLALALGSGGAWAARLPPAGLVGEAAEPSNKEANDAAQAASQTHRYASGHILVKIPKSGNPKAALENAGSHGFGARSRVFGSDWYTLSLPPGIGVREAARLARGLAGVESATPDPIIQLLSDTVPPQDPLYTQPSAGCDPLIEVCTDQWGLFKAGAADAWQLQTGSEDVVIAILDSGIDLDHDDLFGNIWQNAGEIANNLEDDDNNGIVDDRFGADFSGANIGAIGDDELSTDNNPDIPEGGEWYPNFDNFLLGISFDGDAAVGDGNDNNGDGVPDLAVFHGTAVAGIAGAMANNLVPGSSSQFEGMVGVCWHCRIMPVRMTHAEGGAFLSDAAAAINYASAMGADVINMSWGFSIESFTPGSAEIAVLVEAIADAHSAGAILVAAAGNAGSPGVYYPAADHRVIAVGSSGPTDLRSEFSSYAAIGELPGNNIDDDGNGWVDDIVDVVAPGESIWTSWVLSAYDSFVYTELFGYSASDWPPGIDTYNVTDGTSFAAPLVAGYMGLLRSQCPNLSASDAQIILRENAFDIYGPGYDELSGYGRLQMLVPSTCPGSGAGGADDDTGSPEENNTAPVAVISGDLTVRDTGKPDEEMVRLSGADSYDPDFDSLTYLWRVADALPAEIAGSELAIKLSPGSYTVSLSVTDTKGNTVVSEETVTVLAKNAADETGGDSGQIDTSTGSEKGGKKCNDGKDNDGDGAIDSEDLGCR